MLFDFFYAQGVLSKVAFEEKQRIAKRRVFFQAGKGYNFLLALFIIFSHSCFVIFDLNNVVGDKGLQWQNENIWDEYC